MPEDAYQAEIGYFCCNYRWIRCETLAVYILGARVVRTLELCCGDHCLGHRVLVPNSLWKAESEDLDTQRFPSSHKWLVSK